jgi:AraC family transcriptional regulator of adaptative response / DNA-3-methyladenine glycosylase II
MRYKWGMSSHSPILLRAMMSRDRRYDGRFFIGVHSTGIYCRPICPAKRPLLKNIEFFPSAAAAEAGGLRPCRRCRPECSPGTPAWLGSSASVIRALRLLDGFAETPQSLTDLCAKLGIGERQLRRLFHQHLGASPQAILSTRRLDFARHLVDQSTLSISDVAFASGFESLRRFNDAFKKRFGLAPQQARRQHPPAETGVRLRLAYRPPYQWGLLLAFLRGRALPGVELVSDDRYVRSLNIDGYFGWLEVTHDPNAAALWLRIELHPSQLMKAVTRIKQLFDLEADPVAIQSTLEEDPALKARVKKLPGLRVPGAWDGFELAVRAILGQQVSVAGARTLAGRLVTQFGKPATGPTGITHHFPTPEAIRRAPVEIVGLPKKRAQTIRDLAAAIDDRKLVLHEASDWQSARETLLAIPGIGPWTVEYISMRALRDPDAFPSTDLIVKRMVKHLGESGECEAWRPWRAYATMYLWKLSEEL